jgi:hypothetical protein
LIMDWSGTGKLHHGDVPLAVPDLAIAAQILARPLPMVEGAAQEIQPYRHADGRPCWSIHQLARALNLVESGEARRRGRAPERAAS